MSTQQLPPEFLSYWHGLLKFFRHRGTRPAHRYLQHVWQQNAVIPGYGTWRQWFAQQWPERAVPQAFNGDYPRGWSYANLLTHRPSKAAQQLPRAVKI